MIVREVIAKIQMIDCLRHDIEIEADDLDLELVSDLLEEYRNVLANMQVK